MLAAQQLLDKIENNKPVLVQSMRQLSEAYIELAYHSVSHLRKQQHGKPLIVCVFLLNFLHSSCPATTIL